MGEKDGVVVLFSNKDFGTVVKSSNPNHPVGSVGDFNEADFTVSDTKTELK